MKEMHQKPEKKLGIFIYQNLAEDLITM